MTKPTLESLNEAAQAAGLRNWAHAQSSESLQYPSIIAHALTLDKLHGRKGRSEAETLWGDLVDCVTNEEAVALIEAKFAELRAPKEPEWIEWYGGECPVAEGAYCEVKFRSGECNSEFSSGNWSWKHFASGGDIIAYRIFP